MVWHGGLRVFWGGVGAHHEYKAGGCAVYDPDHGTEAAEELGCEAEEHSIATADACTRSLSGNRKVRRSEII